jgi:UDP-N-acetylglucosamine acyltransferase
MTAAPSRIHPTALVAPEAEIAADVQIGPYVVIEGKVQIGPGCVLRPHVHLCGPMTLGRGNIVFTGSVLGERPQHLHYRDEPTTLEIGDENVIRENVTIHRGTAHSQTTRIGNQNFLMANCHVAHDCQVGNRCIIANGTLLAGHCVLEDNVYLSGNCAVHQFVHIGRLAFMSGVSATSRDVPPFLIHQGYNCVAGVNVVGMRRAGLGSEQIEGVRRAYQIIFRQGQLLSAGLDRAEHELGTISAVAELIGFIRASKRGINIFRARDESAAA